MMPSAPTAAAPRASASTRRRSPAAWLGSTITGRCVWSFSHGIAPRSSVKRVAVSNVRIPRSHSMTSLVALLEDVVRGHAAAPRAIEESPRLSSTGRPACRRPRAARSSACCARRSGRRRRTRGPRRPAGVDQLGDDRQAGLRARLGEDLEPGRPEALERERRRPRLVGAAAQHRGAAALTVRATVIVCSRVSTVQGPAIRQNVLSPPTVRPAMSNTLGAVVEQLGRGELVRAARSGRPGRPRRAPRSPSPRTAADVTDRADRDLGRARDDLRVNGAGGFEPCDDLADLLGAGLGGHHDHHLGVRSSPG